MISRRRFIGTALGAGLALSTQGCQQMASQPARKRMIVDAQVHLWKPESGDWRWVPGLKPQLPEPFTIERLLPMMDEAGVDRVVIVPPSWPGGRPALSRPLRRNGPYAAPKSAIRGAAAEMEGAARNARRPRHLHRRHRVLADGRDGRLVLARSREGGSARHVSCAGPGIEVRQHRGAPPAAHARHRPHGPELFEPYQQAYRYPGGDRPGRCARQISERQRQAVGGARQFARTLSVP